MTTLPPARARRFDVFEWMGAHEGLVDAIIAAFVATLTIIANLFDTGTFPWWSLAMLLCVAFLRTHTEVATMVLGLVIVAHTAFGPGLIMTDVLVLYAAYCCASRARPFTRRLVLLLIILGIFIAAVYNTAQIVATTGMELPIAIVIAAIGWTISVMALLVVWALGYFQRARSAKLVLAQERALAAEREQEQLAQLAVAAERSRIAREMHDVIAHSLSVMIAQADGGRYLAATAPDKTPDIFATIASTGRLALTDMRSLLGVLRENDTVGRTPQTGLAHLPHVIESFRRAGLQIDLPSTYPPPPSFALLDLTLLRVIQEALTNVLKHAGPTSRVAVGLENRDGTWYVSIRNWAPTQAVPDHEVIPSAGQGLRGMRERLRVLGGTLEAGPTADGGFSVTAQIPANPHPATQ